MKHWIVKPTYKELTLKFSKALDVHPLISKLLINRGIIDLQQADTFLYGDLTHCYDPFIMKDMEKTVLRIKQAFSKKENILVYGDYDVDGVSSVALISKAFKKLGIDVFTYIPNRIDEGYGLNEDAVRFAKKRNISLIITVDCGISGVKEVDLANSLGIDVIITDHHEVDEENLPKAYAIIDPHQKTCNYPFKGLAGVGVAFKLVQAILNKRDSVPTEYLDLVALGTVADIVPQISENRIFTKYGLERLQQTDSMGLRALIDLAGLKDKTLDAQHIGFGLGPRINAMGRMGAADKALELLLSEDWDEAYKLAKMLNEENARRQKIEADITTQAKEIVEREFDFKKDMVIVIEEDKWHSGVIGIVASRLVDKYHRPSIVIALDKDNGKGSGRSIPGFDLFKAISHCKDTLEGYGGHEMACGININIVNIEQFKKQINEYAKNNLDKKMLIPRVDIDACIDMSIISKELIQQLDMLKPFGPGNRKPVLASKALSLQVDSKAVGKNGIKMWVKSRGASYEAICFNKDNISIPGMREAFDMVYTPSINTWQGLESIQLEIKDIRVHV
ncbi:MAG: single-stranded-DNA-specific exonuclease RecJ [Candidatus Omnitrophica bacterium]|nr:single-stranded-DNA-specific exonuclease RecJ [Candidatus Omnitrophota bacterium]